MRTRCCPTDYVTPWLAAGKPVMNPVNGMVTYLATGKTSGPYVSSTTSPNYVAGEPTGTGALTSITSPLFGPAWRVPRTTSPSSMPTGNSSTPSSRSKRSDRTTAA